MAPKLWLNFLRANRRSQTAFRRTQPSIFRRHSARLPNRMESPINPRGGRDLSSKTDNSPFDSAFVRRFSKTQRRIHDLRRPMSHFRSSVARNLEARDDPFMAPYAQKTKRTHRRVSRQSQTNRPTQNATWHRASQAQKRLDLSLFGLRK